MPAKRGGRLRDDDLKVALLASALEELQHSARVAKSEDDLVGVHVLQSLHSRRGTRVEHVNRSESGVGASELEQCALLSAEKTAR